MRDELSSLMNSFVVHLGLQHAQGRCVAFESVVVNCPTEPYDHDEPDEYRVEPHGDAVPYDWARRDG